ncbi:MAG TPA: C40 family peptidase [Fimbriimonadaceae bacterium]|jgi:cell wall-associated NlpC family hydrolase
MRIRILTIFVALLACVPAFADKVVLGKLGQALVKSAIYSRASVRSRIYYRVKPYEYLVLQSSKNDAYYRVLLQNGAYGYIPTDYVAKLPYDVTADQPSVPSFDRDGSALTSRSAGSRAQVAKWSLNFKGTPYKWGGNDPQKGIDCSGFVKFLYGQIGLQLPRTAAEQAYVGTPIRRLESLQPGDRLYFWSYKRNMIGHTGLYLGNGYFVHSSTNHHGVDTDYLTQKWLGILVAARR